MLDKNTERYLREYIETDAQGNEIVKIEYGEKGLIEQKMIREYNPKNLLVKEQIFDDQELIEHRSWEYDDQGKIHKEFLHYADHSYDTTLFLYDSQGNIIEKRTTDDEGEEGSREEILYESGLVCRHRIYDEEGEIEADDRYTYDDQKRLIKKELLNLDGEEETLEASYNEMGKVAVEVLLNDEGKIIERNTYTYNEAGLAIEIHEETVRQNNTTKISYNDQQQVVLHELYDVGKNLVNRVERSYDEKGRPTKAEILISMPERGIRHHYLLTYEYEA
ncbi:MAG: hypothetical protein CSA95_02060 [Bacteroidetes bacterium]|nr:MAG: hypothetical protein CSA95_02060 [Bacteroidota bacterium]